MERFLENRLFLVALTFVAYLAAKRLQQWSGRALLNPLLISIVCLITFLSLSGIGYEGYREAGGVIDFWLKPAVVALAVPLYRQLSTIRRQMVPIVLAELAGCVTGILSVVLIAQLLGASREVVLSLAAKSVTTPIALEVTACVGGIPALGAAVVVAVGIFGNIAGFQIMRLAGLRGSVSQGLAMGTAAHAVGTAAAMQMGDRCGAFSSLGLTVNGIFTAILAPPLLQLCGYAI